MPEKTRCPNCDRLTEPGRFCARCGGDLGAPARTAAPSALPVAPRDTVPKREIAPVESPADSRDASRPRPWSRATGGSDIARAAQATTPEAPAERTRPATVVSYCNDLKIECDMAQIFVADINMPFFFRITPLADGVEKPVVEVRCDADNWSHLKELTRKLRKNRSVEHSVNYRPGRESGGVVSFDIYIAYLKDGKRQAFEADVRHKVYPSNSNARQVVDNIIVNISTEIKTGHAADINLRNGLDELASIRDRTGADDTLQSLIDRISSMPRALSVLQMYPSDWRSDEQPGGHRDACTPEDARLDRLTLRTGDTRVHLYAVESLAAGKRRDNDLVTRNFNRAGRATREINDKISRYHARFELHDDRCFVEDGGFDPEKGARRESANGTWLGGRRLPPLGSAELPPGTSTPVSLAGEDVGAFAAFALKATPALCAAPIPRACGMSDNCRPGTLAAVFLERQGGDAPESYVMLVRCAELGRLSPDLAGLKVWRRGDGVRFSAGNRNDWLIPGDSFGLNGKTVFVERFRQWGL
jgi:hypothetical protein